MTRHLILATLLSFAVGSVQAAPPKRDVQMPANYQDCMQPAVLESLVQEGPGVWGLGPSQNTKALRAVQGYFLCHAFTGRGEESCAMLQDMPDFKHAKRLGVECRGDYNVLKVHDALQMKQDEAGIRHCSRWCRLNKSEEDKKMVCPNVCRLALKELKRNRSGACEKTMRTLAKNLGADAEYLRETTQFCRQKFTPKLSDCTEDLGPSNAVDCKSMVGLLRAYSETNPKRCPKDARFSGVCKAMIIKKKTDAAALKGGSYDGPEPFTACDEGGMKFTKLVCDARKATGGLQQKMERPKREGY